MKIYFIAICGKGVGNLAILLKNQGHDVRGSEYSEKTFYPPISNELKQHNIPVTLEFDPNEITPDIDLVVMGGAALIHNPNNPQVQKAKELGLNLISYAKGIGQFISKSENIEVVGNHGKTTTTTLIAHLLKNSLEIDASYFLGGTAKGFEVPVHSGESEWSVCEGDEYPSRGQEPGGKFLYHKPKHVLFTSADWDHKDVYKTEEEYLDLYKDLFKILPEDGTITACLDGINVLDVLENSVGKKTNLYSIGEFKTLMTSAKRTLDEVENYLNISEVEEKYPNLYKKLEKLYYVDEIDYTYRTDTTRFSVKQKNFKTNEVTDLGNFDTQSIGQIGVENSLAAIACLHSKGFDMEKVKEGILSFPGAPRKLELIHNANYKVINDYAHSPIKITSALKAVRTKYPNNKIFVIFQVNQGGLKERSTFEQLKEVFNLSNFVLISRVTPDMHSGDQIFGKDYKDLIKEGALKSNTLKPENVFYTPVITQIKSILENNLTANDVILLMCSGDPTEFIDLTKNIRVQSRRPNGMEM